MELLRDPKLLDRILADFDRCGVVGEQVNKLVGYLATISRKLDEPLGRHRPERQRRRQIEPHGGDPGLRAGGAARQVHAP